jgi:glucan 1,3-beta-glucosidase
MNRANSDYNRVPRERSRSRSPPDSTTFDPYAAYPTADSPGTSPSPHPAAMFAHHSNESGYTLPPDLDDAPPRARFMGNPGDPSVRASLASSNFLYDGARGTASEHGSSVYALNDMGTVGSGGVPQSRMSRYLDDPSQHGSDPSHPDHAFADEDPHHAYAPATTPAYLPEKRAAYAPRRRRNRIYLIGGIAAAVLLILAIAIPVAIVESKHKNSSDLGNNGDDSKSKGGDSKTATESGGNSKSKVTVPTSGGDGSTVTMEDGTTFTYHNSFGGTWYYDENDPWNNAAQPNSWTPPLNQSFKYGVNRIWGVNLGGWLNTEPFM